LGKITFFGVFHRAMHSGITNIYDAAFFRRQHNVAAYLLDRPLFQSNAPMMP